MVVEVTWNRRQKQWVVKVDGAMTGMFSNKSMAVSRAEEMVDQKLATGSNRQTLRVKTKSGSVSREVTYDSRSQVPTTSPGF